MSQGVTYADLKFGKVPPVKIHQEETSEELSYENILIATPGEEKPPSRSGHSKELNHQICCVAFTLAGTCLFLFATTVGFAARYWQVSWQLQQASRAHAANNSLLLQRISAQEESLDQSQQFLGDAEARRSHTMEELKRQEEELRQAKSSLAVLRQDQGDTERTSEARETNLPHARSCQQTGCCPSQWKLFRWKCLWISTAEKSWEESQKDCEGKSSQLLVLKEPWTAEELQGAKVMQNSLYSIPYWIGLRCFPPTCYWVDCSLYKGSLKYKGYDRDYDTCIQMSQEGLKKDACSERYPYICEKTASSSSWS
ncbi:B-cell differentiation antigen CD72-like [Rhineura floridana]|uniref:B-cell differentiation antigen CD72-like n=1 Tax=Rhineura floridana TaxID=261503 RepID=UPI002AC85F6E|nr:B-cell differentiation antigen CD72-like [Rhineura floridana]